ncbi:single-stranded DNA-binding protein [Streptobacillus moniliformis]|uniref:single-stranded DNA-binding protein n=1 Tax=Streptobacillus moniliformis TaxID=34105 RepID=UPI0009BCB2B8|nr:single-stranded DNA-binding protein [Streptobacillus moniliformis]
MKSASFIGRMSYKSNIELKKNVKLIKFELAINKKDSDTEYFKFTAWGKMAEIIETYCQKGVKIWVRAEPRQLKIESKEFVYFQVEAIELLEFKKENKKEILNNFDW